MSEPPGGRPSWWQRVRQPGADGIAARRRWVYGWLGAVAGPFSVVVGVWELTMGRQEGVGWLLVSVAIAIGLLLGMRGHSELIVAAALAAVLLSSLIAIVIAPANPATLAGFVVVLVAVSVTETIRTTLFTWGLCFGVAVLPLLSRDPSEPALPVGSNLQTRIALVFVVGVLAVGSSHFSDRVLEEVRARNRSNLKLNSDLALVLETLELQVVDRTRALTERTRELERITRELDDSIDREVALGEQMRALAETDDLTGLSNRRGFMAILDRTLPSGGWLALADLDHFKQINDTFGHPVGDAVLRRVAQQLAMILPPEASVCRIGGEEFAVVLPDGPGWPVSESTARRLVQDLVAAIRTLAWSQVLAESGRAVVGSGWRVTMSIGAARFEPGLDGGPGVVSELLRRADHALYDAKANGRDRARIAEHAPSVGGPGEPAADAEPRC